MKKKPNNTKRLVHMTDDDIAAMWDKVVDLFDEPDEPPVSAPTSNYSKDSDEEKFLK